MFTPNRASKIATRHNGRFTEYTTTSKKTVNAIMFDKKSYEEFMGTNNGYHVRYRYKFSIDIINSAVVIY